MRFQKTLTLLTLAMGLVFALSAWAQQKPFTRDQVQGLVRDGLGDESGAKLIEQRGIDFALAEDFLQTLKAAGASEAFLKALRAAKHPEPASATATAELVVETSPNAEVFLDGVSQGHAHGEGGLNTRAKPGVHELKVSLKGKKDFEQSITLAPLQVTRIEARLKDLVAMPGTGEEVIYPKVARESIPTPPNLLPPWLPAKPQAAKPQGQDATAMEDQYKTCAGHYIPADKCTPEIYQQLKDKDNALQDSDTAFALKAVKEYQSLLLNPASMQIQTAYVTYRRAVCLKVGGQNGLGGMAVNRVVYQTQVISRGKHKGEMKGELDYDDSGKRDPWLGVCTEGFFVAKMVPGTDVTDSVNQALKEGK
jgi:hypothetical protein